MSTHARIDVHTHVVPSFWAQALDAHGGDHSGTVMPGWSVDSAIAFMDSQEIATSILSLTSPGVSGWPTRERPDMTRRVNEFTAGLVADRADRFGMFATLPLPDVAASLNEIERVFDDLNADGIVMLSNVNGRYPGEPEFEPIWAELDRRAAVVLLHSAQPLLPLPTNFAAPLVDFPFDTTRAAVQLVLSRATQRYPNVRIILVHAGGFLPFIAYRVAELARAFDGSWPAPEEILAESRRFFVDTALSASLAALPTITTFVPHDRILYGSDNPYAPAEVSGFFASSLDDAAMPANEAAAINRDNALELFPRFAESDRSRLGHARAA